MASSRNEMGAGLPLWIVLMFGLSDRSFLGWENEDFKGDMLGLAKDLEGGVVSLDLNLIAIPTKM